MIVVNLFLYLLVLLVLLTMYELMNWNEVKCIKTIIFIFYLVTYLFQLTQQSYFKRTQPTTIKTFSTFMSNHIANIISIDNLLNYPQRDAYNEWSC